MNDRSASRQVGFEPGTAFQRAADAYHRGDLPTAEKLFRAMLRQHPNHFAVLSNLAKILLSAGRNDDAVRFARKALNQEPNSAETHALLARLLQGLDRHDEALERARRAVALNAGMADAHSALAAVLATLGRYDEAIAAQARAIELAPEIPRYYYEWGIIKPWTAGDPRLAALDALAQKSGSLTLGDQVYVNFALAKAYEDGGDVERAFRRRIEGGALKRQTLRYNEAATLRRLDELCRTLDAPWMRRHQGVGDPSPLPVFILGMPRSGSSLVEQILASHPQVHALGEREFFDHALIATCGTPAAPPSLAHLAAGWSGATLRRLGGLYLEAARRAAPAAAARISDKMPGNFQFVGLIHASLPNARIIHTCRDPVDTCLSIFAMHFSGSGHPYAYDRAELGRYYRAYEKMMAHWRDVLPAGVMLDVQYEAVVEDVEREARRIVAHCGLDWDDSCLAFYQTARPVRTASHAQVREPIYRRAIRRQRPPHDLLHPLLAALGAV